ncbi:helix-turn-helix transcriptional regulator [Erysipelothrix sp. HDW6A]|uniref:AraC family transcriptional regulator n=1 Tax=Erysipelothrix sp. HDW6A TaxID=2714928 RepID=UPI00140CE759|nr:AraC family transcriptional regulator [Erysipelothrix sp. HDW6A]QIK58185.1 helix-turn-helix transcriptional regulator [Erysipelothrix sp. HDW6A]
MIQSSLFLNNTEFITNPDYTFIHAKRIITDLNQITQYVDLYFDEIVILQLNCGEICVSADSNTIHVSKGQILYLGNHHPYDILFSKGKIDVTVIYVKREYIYDHIRVTTLINDTLFFECNSQIKKLFESILVNLPLDTPASNLVVKGDTLSLIGHVLSFSNRVDGLENAGYSKKIQELCEYIKDNYPTKITLNDLSLKFGYSNQYISTLFKKELNTTFLEYLTYKRIQRAKYLLSTTNDRIVDISYACGFSDERRFITHFKKRYGVTPARFRKMLKDGADQ